MREGYSTEVRHRSHVLDIHMVSQALESHRLVSIVRVRLESHRLVSIVKSEYNNK